MPTAVPTRQVTNTSSGRISSARLLLPYHHLSLRLTLASFWSSEESLFTEFTADIDILEKAVDRMAFPNISELSRRYSEPFPLTAFERQMQKFACSHHCRILVLTDGCSSNFSDIMDPASSTREVCLDGSCIVVSLSGSQVNSALRRLQANFKHSSLLSAASVGATNLPTDRITDMLVNAVFGTQTCESEHPTLIACGHLFSSAVLTPRPCFRHRDDLKCSDLQIFVEIFGFLNAADISHPPIRSRHTLLALPQANAQSEVTPGLLEMLLLTMGTTLTVAMVTVYLQPPVSRPTVLKLTEDSSPPHVLPDSRGLLTHGFIHRFNSKRDCLMLSLFSEECTGLPWLGQFAHLAPVADFAGSLLYNDADNTTPFPVREADKLSYKQSATSDFQYVNWVHSPHGPTNDINKVVRLAKRLPEKSAVFFKELNRVKAAALACGWPSLLSTLYALILESVQKTPETDAHLETISKILTIPNDDGDQPMSPVPV
ncbi:hypothetical protein AAHC03_024475 [Spirometra sp. Aus1]